MSAIAQLPLAIQLPDDETFATFEPGDNIELLDVVQQQQRGLVYLWGRQGVGKSHLLHALCANTQQPVMYLPLGELKDSIQPQVLQGLEQYSLLCLDDIEAVLSDTQWCYELFALFNRVRDLNHGLLVITARNAPAALDVAVADVHSRLQWGLTLQVKPLNDDHKVAALQARAKNLGLSLSEETAQFMVQRLGRDMRSLMRCLTKLDRASIAAKRRLTIPFVKDVLAI
ncbi:DnaA regulatory inactivator Hda [Pseudidiomarina donghaiensis]|uniref:DnaA regulatory inactivator Hda n=1 Tax=Pseudidiomarina donghaiensis TaxID=519452 RepID=UPI0008DF6C76|nr:DnaA regulatory inactivator Hda [Pseudidiomarina donghaiensis]SFV24640.1 regulatory inactivation of DnaA Hda protein [Pseudidiomarina donghaiensis]